MDTELKPSMHIGHAPLIICTLWTLVCAQFPNYDLHVMSPNSKNIAQVGPNAYETEGARATRPVNKYIGIQNLVIRIA